MGNIFWAKSSAPVKDDTSRGVKRKTVPYSETLITRSRLSESDGPTTFEEHCSKRGVKRKASGPGEDEPPKKKAEKGSPDLNRETLITRSRLSESDGPTTFEEHCSKRGVKRKASGPGEDEPPKKKAEKGSPDLNRLSESDGPTTFEEHCSKRGVKRKASGHGEEEPLKKKAKKGSSDLNLFGKESAEDSGKESCNASVEDVRAGKRKAAADGEEPKTRKKRRLDLEKQAMDALRAEFETKYEQQDQLGEGGCATVFAGYRKADNLPVAIKRNPKDRILCKQDGTGKKVYMEVAIMLKLADKTSGSVGMSAPVSLLDWYDLDQELILVLERPIPAKDLLNYICQNKIGEQHAKIILKQLVDAAIHLEEKKIFHRDIKMENILIDTSSDVPRVRLIDFGVSCFVKRGACYQTFFGTNDFIPPEWFSHYRYRAGPTTVWQMGVVLFETLHCGPRFETNAFLENRMTISKKLSKKCQHFLRSCLITDPKERPTLEQLGIHPWLNTTDTDTHLLTRWNAASFHRI